MHENIDFGRATKIVFDGSMLGVNKHFICMAIRSGEEVQVFAMVPADAKNLCAVLANTVNIYEQTYGVIPDSNQPVPSPIQL